MRRKLITIRDVAERAGVSMSTVSHVLNRNDHHVSAARREMILAAVEELGYRPNAIARSMVKQETATVGLVLTEIDNPLFIPVIAGIENILRPAGYHIVLANAPSVEDEIQAIETLRSQQVDGFIFMSLSICYPFDHLVRLKNENVPFVVINRYLEDEEISQVLWNDHSAGYLATHYLLSLGHTRIGTISGPIYNIPQRRSANERHRGWQQALEERGLTVSTEQVVVGDYTYEGGYQAAQTLLTRVEKGAERPTALYVANEAMAVSVLKVLHDAELRVPTDISIITTGDPPFAPYTIPALTTLSLPVYEAGQIASRRLLEWLTLGKPVGERQVTLSFSMKIRESCSAYTRDLYTEL
ncbi:MAG TPA: LacI family DNA-binding transcriptional regulator [Ktedonobacteraceae bacterium]|nr:LacI family DNA-binding transcriptional regulator [Ktedonobacteraceae bacterium]